MSSVRGDGTVAPVDQLGTGEVVFSRGESASLHAHAMSLSRTRDFLAQCSIACLVTSLSHAEHVHVAQGLHGSSHNGVLCSQKHRSSHLAQHGTPYTFSVDSAIIEYFFISHLHSNPPFDQTINGTSADFTSSDEIYHCDDPINVSFGSLADLHSATGYEPKDPAEEDNLVQVKPFFCHRPSMNDIDLWFC